MSVRKAKQILAWLNSLHLQSKQIDIQNYHAELCSGVLFAKLFRLLVPGSDFTNLTERPLSRNAAVQNLELSLAVIFRSKGVNFSHIPTAGEIFEGNKTKIVVMLQEIFDVYVRPQLFASGVKIMKWFNFIMNQYKLRIPLAVFTENDFTGMFNTFRSGVAIFCVIYHLHGPVIIGEGNPNLS